MSTIATYSYSLLLFCLCYYTTTLSAQQLRLSANYKGGANYLHQEYSLENHNIGQQHSLGIQLQYRPFPKANLHLLTGLAFTTTILPFKEVLSIAHEDGNGWSHSSSGPFSNTRIRLVHHLSIPIFLMRKNEKNRGIYGGVELHKLLFTNKLKNLHPFFLEEKVEEPWKAPSSFYVTAHIGYHFDIKSKFQLSIEGYFNLKELANDNNTGQYATWGGLRDDRPYHIAGLKVGFGYYFYNRKR